MAFSFTIGGGFSFTKLEDRPLEYHGPTALTFVFPDETATFSYAITDAPDDDLPLVALTGPAPLAILINDVVIDLSEFEIAIGRLPVEFGGDFDTHVDVLILENAEGRQFVFDLNDASQATPPSNLPPVNNYDDLAEFFQAMGAAEFAGRVPGPLPADSPFAPSTAIQLATHFLPLPYDGPIGPGDPGDPPASGDFSVVALQGIRIQYDEDSPVDVGPTGFHAVLRAAQNAQFRYEIDEDADPAPGDLPQVNILSPFVYQMAVGDQAVSSDFEFDVGRITRNTGDVHDVLVFRNVETDTDYIFLLAGDPLPALNDPADMAAFELSIVSVEAIAEGEAFGPNTNTPFLSIANITENGDPQVIKAGNVSDDPGNSWVDIGAGGFGDPGDGSVTALNGGVYQREADDLMVNVGGWGNDGVVNALGAGSTISFESGSDPDSQVSVTFGVDGGYGRLDVVNGVFQIQNGHAPAENNTRSYLGVGELDGEAEFRVDNGSAHISGFNTSYLTVGQWGGSGQVDLQNGSTLSMTPAEFARIWVGMFNNPGEMDGGRINVETGSSIVVDNLHELLVGVGSDWSEGRGQITITGAGSEFLATVAASDTDPGILIGGENGQGALNVSNGGRFALLPDDMGMPPGNGPVFFSDPPEGSGPAVHMGIGQLGNGSVQVQNGGIVDLGGAATVKVGGVRDTSADPGWGTSGNITLGGMGSSFTGFTEAWFSYDPNAPDQSGVQNNWGNLFLFDNAVFGNPGAQIHLGDGSMLMWNGTPRIEGDVHLHGGMIDSHGWDNTATIDGNLNVVQGNNWVMMSATHLDDGVDFGDPGTRFMESWNITGAFNLQGGSFDLNLHSFWGYEFQRGETHQLITYGQLIDGDADFSANVSHFGESDFAWKMAFDRLVDGSLTFIALNDSNPMDGADPALRHALLDFSGGATALHLEYDAPDQDGFTPGQIEWLGGGWYGGLASATIDEIRGTAQDDLIDLRGFENSIEIHAGAGNDTIFGGEGDDILMGGLGDDVINGGGGVNTALFTGAFVDYIINTDDAGVTTITDMRAGAENEGTDTLTNIRYLQFSDTTFTIDLPTLTGPALNLTQLGQIGSVVTYAVQVDPALVSGGVLQDMTFTLSYDSSLISFVEGSASAGFSTSPGSIIFTGADLGIDSFDTAILTFEMALAAMAGPRNVALDVSDVSLNGTEMEAQSFGFDYAHVPGAAVSLVQISQNGAMITYGVMLDPALVAGDTLDTLSITFDFDHTLIDVTGMPGSGVFALDLDAGLGQDFSQPVTTFDMYLTSIAGARSVDFALRDIDVNGFAMTDGTASFDYPPLTYTLSGTVNIREVSPGAVSQAGTQVTFTAADGSTHSTVTDGSGVFSFELDAGISGDLSFVRDYDAVVDKALSIDDVIALFQLVMHPDPATAFGPLDMLAADFDGDETASVDDVIALFGFVMDIPGAQPARYVFIDDADPLPPVDVATIPPAPASFEVGPLLGDAHMSITGILSGDLYGY